MATKLASPATLLKHGAGLKVGKLFYVAGVWYDHRATGLSRVPSKRLAGVNEAHADDLRRYHDSLIETPHQTTPKTGVSPKPVLGMRNFGGSPDRMQSIMAQMGKYVR